MRPSLKPGLSGGGKEAGHALRKQDVPPAIPLQMLGPSRPIGSDASSVLVMRIRLWSTWSHTWIAHAAERNRLLDANFTHSLVTSLYVIWQRTQHPFLPPGRMETQMVKVEERHVSRQSVICSRILTLTSSKARDTSVPSPYRMYHIMSLQALANGNP